jgi:glycosyltransferase involved in cell wall biosynthesis
MRKKKVLFHSDFPLACTGFAKNTKNVLSYLYNTNKYEVVAYNCGMIQGDPNLLRTPWKSYGTVPANKAEFDNILNQHPPEHRDPITKKIAYGEYYLDWIIQTEKPDIYIGAQDIWGVDYSVHKHWFDKIHSVIWTTLDSLPLLPSAVDMAPKIKNYWIWSDFATKEMHRLGHKHVRTMHGAIDCQSFYRLEEYKRKELRKKFNIDEDCFIAGFVFRNQLRKSAPNLIEGFKLFKSANSKIKAKLLLHTHFGEHMQGWNIPKLAQEYGVSQSDILTTYVCKNCRNYEIKSFTEQDINCSYCKSEKSCNTTNVQIGVNENQLNEIYNLMDVYVHPFTSGGQEIPIQEAKLTELITLVTNYSCGEEMCQPGAGSFILDWAEYREQGTQFRKASTYPSSIAKQLTKVYEMKYEDRRKIGKQAREWVINNFSMEQIGKQIETFIDNCPDVNFDFNPPPPKTNNPQADMEDILTHPDDSFFVDQCYNRILNVEPDLNGKQYWIQFLNK